MPIYLANEDRIIGLMFLLTIALRCFTLMEFQVSLQLQTQQNEIVGLYAGNPKRKTQRSSAEQLLKAFAGITLYHHRDGTSEITPLNKPTASHPGTDEDPRNHLWAPRKIDFIKDCTA